MRTLVLLAAAAIGGMATAQTTGTQTDAQTTGQAGAYSGTQGGTAGQAATGMQAGDQTGTGTQTGTGMQTGTGTQMGTGMQTGTGTGMDTGAQAGTGSQTTVTTGTGVSMAQGGGEVAAPGNSNPELDARGIPVISAPAEVPAGANQPVAAAPGAQVVPAANQQAVFSTRPGAESYPPCTATVTDNCVQAYVGRRSSSSRRR